MSATDANKDTANNGKPNKPKNLRALAAKVLFQVVDKGRSLGDELPNAQDKLANPKDKGLLQEICYGVLRYLPQLEYQSRQFINKPLTGKQRVFHFLILVGIYQLRHTRIPDHAAISETVAACDTLKSRHMKGLTNGVLRNVQRDETSEEEPLKDANDAVKYNHPGWLLKTLQAAYPDDWQSIVDANMQRPPMWLRVNQSKISVDDYIKLLNAEEIEVSHRDKHSQAIRLANARDVNTLPGFSDGFVSIQDGAAQHAAVFLQGQENEHILDACAAPGGKTCHILELTNNNSKVTALDVEQHRLNRVADNLQRLKLSADIVCADASDTNAWWDGQQFDRILLDAPCSGTGVIRKHPDIKWLRRSSDIDKLVELQQQILQAVWSTLKPGGTMIYATCSILPQENRQQVEKFVANTDDAEWLQLGAGHGNDWQILPGQDSKDGFYYARLGKKAN
ncbi:16S rRNA (cytosine(967)-C(5))-methyltransferase RsmB [Thalassotalea sp. PS06]|uniref:16S rRNA (cytosine(967)-C(5))-methyltransferase RsmB n=1 Tax=Thalassotalea sp. PS06 TaxID=2594005 RepID=UPI001163A693|nr:16S rRNA (cytosine(967)-C(5))-methyltransferase RsmB [Thalassotalea sp. PS06]QDO99882.1 16S rRNA (cytosine(967)-C(5))-methyltransferase RsmB [Thalassotalea sp. PS06]